SSDLQRHRIVLRSELADDLPTITGDRIQLQQVVINLLRNASDAMVTVDDRPRQLLIRTEREDDRVRLTVRVAGVGLDPQSMNKLFDAFYTRRPTAWERALRQPLHHRETPPTSLGRAERRRSWRHVSFSIPAGSPSA